MDSKVFDNKNILIVGGTGFIGQSLLGAIDSESSKITVLSRRSHIYGELLRGKKTNITSVKGDVADPRTINKLVKGKDIILNFAGGGKVESMEDPVSDLKTTCEGSLNILEACKKYNKKCKIIFSGSRMELGRVAKTPAKEDAIPHPTSFYGIHRYAVSQYAELYHELFGLKTTVLRFSSIYGPRYSENLGTITIVNKFIDKAKQNEKLLIYGNGSQLRDFLYIDDALRAIFNAVKYKAAEGEIFNIGSGERTKFIDMAKMVVRMVGQGKVMTVPWPKKFLQIEAGDYVSDYTKAHKLIKWKPEVYLKDGIRKTIHLSKI